LRKYILAAIVSAAIAGAVLVPSLSQEFADAKSTKKVHFTETFVSAQDPGQGHGNHQLALLLSPQEGIIYDGSMTYTADRPVQIVVLHEIGPSESRGQPVWTVDGKTVYASSVIDAGASSGSFEFTGAALALRSPDPETFTATASVDGWVRGGSLEFVTKTIEIRQDPPSVELYRASVPATIPMHSGLYGGNQTHYIITDASDESLATEISEEQGWNVEVAPPLSEAPESVLGQIYFFANGVNGDGLYGFQDEVFSSTPGQDGEYSALREAVNVSWKLGQNSDTLHSVDDIEQAEKNGRIEIDRTGIVLNAPQIAWPGGQMALRAENGTDDTPYAGGQVLEIDEENGTVTFVAHRGWGPDGSTVYCIATDATPSGPAEMMGVAYAPSSAELVANSTVPVLYQFKNGLAGSGQLGFQPGIAASAPGDGDYSPVWRIFIAEWNSEEDAVLLETVDDIDSARADGLVTVSAARPLGGDHVVNCPLIDPLQDRKG